VFRRREVLQLYSLVFLWLDLCFKFDLRRFINDEPKNDDQWKEGHAVIQANVFDRISMFSSDSGVKVLYPRCTNQMHSPK
jgi:hypothetical protein